MTAIGDQHDIRIELAADKADSWAVHCRRPFPAS
jgi:hypothetical protein